MTSEAPKQMTREEKIAKWGPGPWADEPDHVEFRHNGVPCILHRHPSSGHWCAYAAVEPGHPWHGMGYSGTFDVDTDEYVESPVEVSVHGGLTYADRCRGDVCHVAQPGEPDDVWWFGCDFAHSGDYCPVSFKYGGLSAYESYRDIDYVRREAESLAEQLIAARNA